MRNRKRDNKKTLITVVTFEQQHYTITSHYQQSQGERAHGRSGEQTIRQSPHQIRTDGLLTAGVIVKYLVYNGEGMGNSSTRTESYLL